MIKTRVDLEDRVMATTSLRQLFREATQSVEDQLRLEDAGWTNVSNQSSTIISPDERIANLRLSRLYATKDPLGKQAVRLWTDYTFGRGMTWKAKDEHTQKILETFWDAQANASVLSPKGQRTGSDKLLIDGEVFFAIFLGNETRIRFIDPLEIAEIITDPDDKADVRYYRRAWITPQADPKDEIYRSITNIKDKGTPDAAGKTVRKTQDALIYHLAYNTIMQRGNPLLLPALDWITQYRRFLASRIAIMLALARFAWRSKVKGGQAAVDAIKAKTDDAEIDAASHLIENMGVDTQPIKTESGAAGAKEDGRMIRLQICAAVGIPEQYFGDISTGNLATAKTVELPLMKMFQSYQQVWADTYKDINEVVLGHKTVDKDKQYVDMDFPPIAPLDAIAIAQALSQIVMAFPQLADSDDVIQQALMAIGVNDIAEVMEKLKGQGNENTEAAAIKSVRRIMERIERGSK